MGTPALAAHILDRLIAASDPRFQVVAAVTQPDEPRGRGMTLTPSEVATVAARHNLPTLKPRKVRTPEFVAELKSLAPDLLVVAAYGRILPDDVLAAPRLMPINVHASLLPRHRGAAPIEGAILAGDRETGATIMRITAQMDAGPMLLERSVAIAPDETQATLKAKLAEVGAAALLDALDAIARGTAAETPQDESQATYTHPIKKQDATIDWNLDAAQIERMTRAFDPWPIARTTVESSPLLIWRAETVRAAASAVPGAVLDADKRLEVACGTGALRILELQVPGRKRMTVEEFLRGRRLAVGQRLGT